MPHTSRQRPRRPKRHGRSQKDNSGMRAAPVLDESAVERVLGHPSPEETWEQPQVGDVPVTYRSFKK